MIPIAQNANVECFAFEPEPNNFRYLSENVAVNCKYGNVRLLNLALFDKDVSLPFEISPRHSGDHRLRVADKPGKLNEHTRQQIIVQAKRLDDIVTAVPEPIAAKIDVQGAEPFVIAGGRNLLSRANLLSVEFWPYSMSRMNSDAESVITFLTEQFHEARLSARDEDEQSEWQSIDAVADFLRSYLSQQRDSQNQYLNVIARKNL